MSVDLSTQYLGLKLKNPLVVAACPLTGNIDGLRRVEDAGASAAVLPSLFEEQIAHEEAELAKVHEFGADSFAEALTYFPQPQDYRTGPEEYLELITEAKRALRIPIIGSLNGVSTGGWTRYARMIQDAGADALELNIYYVATGMEESAESVESQYLELVEAVKQSVSIPLAVKIGPYFSAMANMAKRLADAGADGLVLFNRFLQPDIDLESMEAMPRLVLSDPWELLLPLRWIAILYGRVDVSLALTRGIHDSQSLLKALAVGADVAMVASVIYRKGFSELGKMLSQMQDWLAEKEYSSVEEFKGCMSQENCPDPAAFARGNYMKALTSFTGKPI